MITYRLLNHEHQWDGDAYLSDIPSEGYLPVIKDEKRAKKFFAHQEKNAEKSLKHWKIKFEKIGETEEEIIKQKKKKR